MVRPAAPHRLCDKTGFGYVLMISSTCLATKCWTLSFKRHAALLEELEELSGALDDLQARQQQEEHAAKAAAAEAASLTEQLQALQVFIPVLYQCVNTFLKLQGLSTTMPTGALGNSCKMFGQKLYKVADGSDKSCWVCGGFATSFAEIPTFRTSKI